jgi:hypothetical protein
MLRTSTHLILLGFAAITAIEASACKGIECGTGTIERDGTCAPADETTGTAKCGPFTMLVGDQCVPMFPPTVCEPGTTTGDLDDTTGVTTCKGTGMSAGCSGTISCPTPAPGKQTVCGQLYNFADNTKFAANNATGARCGSTPTASGPCALQMLAFDAVTFATNSNMGMATTPQAVGDTYIDDCGRYRLSDITPPTQPFLALGIDDAGQPFGPTGVTVTTGVALPSAADSKTKDFEAWIADGATIASWTGGPQLTNGIYGAIFRSHMCDQTTGVCNGDGFATQMGVTFIKGAAAVPANDYYFQSETTHLHIDTNASATSINGTALFQPAVVTDGPIYTGSGGISDTVNCQWESHPAATIPGLLFLQVYRPTAKPLKTCTL